MSNIHLFLIYKISIVAAGILCIYFGYRLFYLTQEKQGDLQIKVGNKLNLKLRDVAPGIFFALFGAGVLLFNLYRAVTFESLEQKTSPAGASQETASPTAPEFLLRNRAYQQHDPPPEFRKKSEKSKEPLNERSQVPQIYLKKQSATQVPPPR